MRPIVSIIIPTKTISPYLRKSIAACLKGSYKNFEIIVLIDLLSQEKFPKTTIHPTGPIGPAQKRDIGAKLARGGILVFIDDDTYPEKQWLSHIMKQFEDPKVGGVGGPGVTPPDVSWQEEASGWVSASPLGSGEFMYRFFPLRKRYVDDYPSMNLSIRKNDFKKVGGFDSDYWPGEDTKLCLDITHKLKKKIVYEPKALVYHHRRPLWLPHLRQHGNFGIHRGYFARILPQTSARPIYFAPSMLSLGILYGLITGIWWMVIKSLPSIILVINNLIAAAFIGYFAVLCTNGIWVAIRSKKILLGLISVPAIFLTHTWYGIRFIQGLFLTKKLIS